ncbi:MAG TPA: trehalose-6-phosphate synthase [Frankiaceae bacterium]|nr:trehalose-6-phosphate synthase [Frankiaceae bacterium]
MGHRGGAIVLVASNRGPLSYVADERGELTGRRGGGGMISALEGHEQPITWVCAALTDGDRAAARAAKDGRLPASNGSGGGEQLVRMLELDRVLFDRAYNAVANRTLWFIAHLLFDTASAPTFGHSWAGDWAAYEEYCSCFAHALAEEAAPGAKVLIQDYHLVLAPRMLRDLRPNLRISHFTHTPWASPDYFRMLPDAVARQILRGMLGADLLGFHCKRWADAFLACCEAVLNASVAGDEVSYEGRTTTVSVNPLGVDGPGLQRRASAADVASRMELLDEQVEGRRLLLRIDRTELSKNIVRGLEAYREMLRTHPEARGEVVHLAFAYPSRHDLPEYREYTAAVQRIASDISEEFGRAGWEPVRLEVSDDFPRSLAAYAMADVLVVNPVRDGMNLVAKEGPVLSQRDLALVLSREAGAVAELGGDALVVNPYDVIQTSDAMWDALQMPGEERAARCERLVAASVAMPPSRWFTTQLDAL